MRYLFFIGVLLFSSNAICLQYANGVVKKIRVFSAIPEPYNTSSNGLALVYLDELPGACESAEKRVVIDSSHPLFQSFISIAMVSKTTKTPISIGYQNTCNLRGNAWDFGLIELLE